MPPPILVPADNVKPSGTPRILTLEITSEPSVSFTDVEMLSPMGEPSSPCAFCADKFGTSTTASTITSIDPVTETAEPFVSVDVAVTRKSFKSASLFAGGLIKGPPVNVWPGDKVIVHVPVAALYVPPDCDVSTDQPAPMPDTVTVKDSFGAPGAAAMFNCPEPSSLMQTSSTLNCGASGHGLTCRLMVVDALALLSVKSHSLPLRLTSAATAVMLNCISPDQLAGG